MGKPRPSYPRLDVSQGRCISSLQPQFSTGLGSNLDVDVHYANINKQQIDLCHENNIKVNVWTVNDQEIANTYAKYGVDFITSNWVKETY